MGHTLLMEQRTAGNRAVVAKVPFFAEMINERACLFWRRKGVSDWTYCGARGPLPKRLLRGFRDERNDCISDWGRWSVGAFLLSDEPAGEHQHTAPQLVERRLQQ